MSSGEAFGGLSDGASPEPCSVRGSRMLLNSARIAHGLLVLSWAAGLVPFDPTRVVALRAVRDVVFKRPAFPGDTLHVEGKIESRTPIDERLGLVTTTWRIVNQRGSGVARARVEVLWRREGAASEPRETDIVGAGVLPL